jgi:NAD(P)-dependent dehydrogenase (short-subunit alcohol dehydrogenase family)
MLRAGLLDGQTIAFAGEAPALAGACARLGAATPVLAADPRDEDAVAAEVAALGAPDTLVCNTGPAFAAAGRGLDGLRDAADAAFVAIRAVANAWIAAGRGGKVVLLAPAAGGGEGAGDGPLRASLENLARTLSVEWARFGIRPTAVLPAASTSADELAELVAFLASPAGDYYSGCAFTLA